MDDDAFQQRATEIFAGLPSRFREAIENVVVITEDVPDSDTMRQMHLDSPDELLGLYSGWPLPERGSSYGGHPPDVIYLYRRPIIAYAARHGLSIDACIRHVLVHEIGHYFGFSDADMERIECQP